MPNFETHCKWQSNRLKEMPLPCVFYTKFSKTRGLWHFRFCQALYLNADICQSLTRLDHVINISALILWFVCFLLLWEQGLFLFSLSSFYSSFLPLFSFLIFVDKQVSWNFTSSIFMLVSEMFIYFFSLFLRNECNEHQSQTIFSRLATD